MRWSDERYVRVYTRDTGEWLALGWEAQALFVFALRKADRAGIVQTGKARARGLAGMTGMPLDVVERVLPLLLEDGCLRESLGGYIIPNFIAAQETPSSDAQRKRDQRERDRDKAVADGSTGSRAGLDAETTMSRRSVTPDGHAVPSRHDVTHGGHAMESRDVTSGHAGTVTPNRAVPSRAELLLPTAPAIGGEVETLPDANEDAVPLDGEPKREELVLTAPTAGRKEPKPSEAQKLYAALESSRSDRCETAGHKFVAQGWDARRINATLGPVVKVRKGEAVNAEGKTEAQQRFEDAWNEYLADDDGATREPPWAIGWFMSGGVRARYETRAIRAQQGAA